jgi:hypothetical protein
LFPFQPVIRSGLGGVGQVCFMDTLTYVVMGSPHAPCTCLTRRTISGERNCVLNVTIYHIHKRWCERSLNLLSHHPDWPCEESVY